jgi:hypothetical protein
MQIEWDAEGLDDTLISIRAVEGELGRELRRLLDEAAERAYRTMRTKVPIGETAQLEFSIRKGPLTFHPGGAGGGGFYEIEVGPGENAPEHLDFVFGGTSDLFGKAMRIQKHGEPAHWIERRRGQPPQTEWVTDAQEEAREWIRRGLNEMDLFR